ncbi:MAG: inositol monophosphatase family protein, partial [Alphaproteobacteria bacterium]
GRRRLDESVVATGIPNMGQGDHERYLATLQAVMGEVASVRRSGSAALDLAYVAAGRYEGFWEFGLKPWDIAAGLLLVREAGGFATAIDGATDPLPAGDVLAANDRMHQAIGRLLRRAMGLRAPRQMTA